MTSADLLARPEDGRLVDLVKPYLSYSSSTSPVCPNSVTPSGVTGWPWTPPSQERADLYTRTRITVSHRAVSRCAGG